MIKATQVAINDYYACGARNNGVINSDTVGTNSR